MTERAPATGRPVSVFGRSVSGRYTWHADNMRVHRAALGRLAGRSATFSAMVARPLSVRSARQEQAAAATRTGYLPVATPAAPYLGAWWQRQAADAAATAEAAATADADRARRTPSVARRSPPGGGGAAVPSAAPEPPPIGLPRVSSRGMRTRAGEATAPGSASERLKSPKIYVRHPDEVAGVGPMLTPREARQAAGPRPSRRADGDPDRPAGGPPAPARRSRASRSSSVHGGAGRVTVGAVARPGPAARAAAGRATARRMAAEVVADRRVALPAARLEPSGPVATLRPGLAAGSAGSGAVARAALAARADQAAPVADEGATGAATGVGLLPIAETRAADTTTGDGGPAGPEAPDHPTAQRSVDDASPAAAGAADRTGPGHRDVASQGPAVRRSGTAGSAPVAATWSADEAAAAVRPGRAPSALRRAASAGLTALRRRPARRGPVTGPGPMPAPPAGARGLTGAAGGEPAPPSSGQRTPGSDQASPTATGRQATGATSGAAVATPRSGAAVATPPSDATGSPVGTPTMAATPPPTSGPEALQRSADIPGPSAAGAGGEAAATSPGGSAADAPGAPAAGASAGSGGFANLATTDAGQP
ncbi:MAG TPA: hypothetical protein VFP61_03000, partial [Acidimicrobiales bacterium]|nr:hypothetical protein [Acidimicrobiales bacterium]